MHLHMSKCSRRLEARHCKQAHKPLPIPNRPSRLSVQNTHMHGSHGVWPHMSTALTVASLEASETFSDLAASQILDLTCKRLPALPLAEASST